MKAIINTFERNALSVNNGLTFPIVGHCNGHIEIEIDGFIVDLELSEILIVDIQTEIRHAVHRMNAIGFDYWHDILIKYTKRNKINIDRKEPQLPKAEKLADSYTFDESQLLKEDDIFNT